MQPQVEHMLEKLEHLSPGRLAEVEDFIDFLSQRDQDKHLRQDYAQASQDTFNKVWDNDDNAVYDSL
ncbi:toxin-antitoxin system, antitoxin component, Xre family protein [Marinobacter sp. Arc7-DN-1]|uniref:toxin-antitoxin system, antitoxin component, Xre family protein n=1 Tax=Marinobacter sp. Arc7-DN-1 TaxID=2304594 RepID=UPI000E44D1C8|nr:toxin-antitoxin system, antitoxin component, Xre family protein [Marinobacter sp. Arc7-DN-1]AXS84113.1 toxin-antitoxin system, antitoxin component, Xre family protein [Marinobacter sp. Arc7-DN-1]